MKKGIREGELLKDIVHVIDNNPTAISKEVLKRRSDDLIIKNIDLINHEMKKSK